jgi:hypothetical protein
MTEKTDYKYREWVILRAAFCAIWLDVAVADNELDDAEAFAWRREVDALAESAPPLIQELLKWKIDEMEDEEVRAWASQTELDVLLTKAGEVLTAKAAPDEIAAYKRGLRSLAIAVAEGSKGGEHEENVVLASINDVLLTW